MGTDKRKIAVITGTRAEFGILTPVLKEINRSKKLQLQLLVTGMHLLKKFGYTVSEIEKSGFKIDAKIKISTNSDTELEMAKSVGKAVGKIAEVLNSDRPDLLLLLGDRGEMMAGAIAAGYMNIPVGHIHGGEVSGNVDESVRHAITKLSHLHFTATEQSRERVIKLGEAPERVIRTGAPSLDVILKEKLYSKKQLSEKLGFKLKENYLLMVQHPVTTEFRQAVTQVRETLSALAAVDYQIVIIYPNSDVGGRQMIKEILRHGKRDNVKVFENLEHKVYLSLLKHCSVLAGNSSSGIIEAPSFKVPVINIGQRQARRERSANIIDVAPEKELIKKALKKALSNKFKETADNTANVWGNGTASRSIVRVLESYPVNNDLLKKQITY
ncbi:UDP-N-acetylglucosamine 2-epimerase [Candidatus Margulisiibacteriota bacterium]